MTKLVVNRSLSELPPSSVIGTCSQTDEFAKGRANDLRDVGLLGLSLLLHRDVCEAGDQEIRHELKLFRRDVTSVVSASHHSLSDLSNGTYSMASGNVL